MIKISPEKIKTVNDLYANEYAKKAFEQFEKVVCKQVIPLLQKDIKAEYEKIYQKVIDSKMRDKKKYVEVKSLHSINDSQTLFNILNKELVEQKTNSELYFVKSPEDIREFCREYYIKDDNERLYFNKFIKQYFNWDTFRDKNGDLLEKIYRKLAVGACPYCNRNYVSIFGKKTKGGAIRPSLDHFFIQKEFPFLALNLWNLIPSCDYCNSKVKHDKEESFDLDSNKKVVYVGALNPLFEGFEDNIRFKLTPKNNDVSKLYEAYYNFNQTSEYYDSFEITFYKKKSILDDDCILFKSSITLFQLRELYNAVHIRDAVDIAVKTFYYSNPAYWQSYNCILSFKDKNDKYENIMPLVFLKYLLFGRCLDKEEHINIPLSKLTSDIFNQFKSDSDNENYELLDLSN